MMEKMDTEKRTETGHCEYLEPDARTLSGRGDSMKDVVCGMEISDDSAYRYQHGGKIFYFCSQHCLDEFKKNPEQYLNKEAPASQRYQ